VPPSSAAGSGSGGGAALAGGPFAGAVFDWSDPRVGKDSIFVGPSSVSPASCWEICLPVARESVDLAVICTSVPGAVGIRAFGWV
jgi:hypothetical protein